MRDDVVTLQVVLADGSVIDTGSRARKSSAGYDLTRLFVGSEGTLGVITEVTVKLHGIPETTGVVVASFHSIDDAAKAAIQIMHAGIAIARVELMDALQMQACRRYSKINHPRLTTCSWNFTVRKRRCWNRCNPREPSPKKSAA